METPEVVYIAINLDQNEEGEWRWRCMDTSGQSIVPDVRTCSPDGYIAGMMPGDKLEGFVRSIWAASPGAVCYLNATGRILTEADFTLPTQRTSPEAPSWPDVEVIQGVIREVSSSAPSLECRVTVLETVLNYLRPFGLVLAGIFTFTICCMGWALHSAQRNVVALTAELHAEQALSAEFHDAVMRLEAAELLQSAKPGASPPAPPTNVSDPPVLIHRGGSLRERAAQSF